MPDVAAVETRDLTKLYQQGANVVRALRGVSIRLEQGEFVAVVGRSGSGKTTLLDVVGLLLRPTAGQVLLDGIDAGRLSERERTRVRRQKVGFVFQEYNLLPTLTALENVVLPLQYERGSDLAAGLQRAAHLLDLVELGDRMHHRPDAMSGGEQQRTAIARSLINSPALVLADEPTAAVDSETTAVLMRLMRYLNQSEGTTLTLVTHDLELAGTAQRIITLRDGAVESVTTGTLQVAVPEPAASTPGPGVGPGAFEPAYAAGLPGAPSPPRATAPPPPVPRPPAAAPPPAPPVPPGPAPQLPTSRELLRPDRATPPVAPVLPTPPASVSHELSAEWITSERLLRNSPDGGESPHTGPSRGDGSEGPAQRRIALIAAGSGAGQTTVSLLLGHQLAGRWGGGVVAVDLDPIEPRLADRIGRQRAGTLDEIVGRLDRRLRYSDVRSFASLAPSGLEVLASGGNGSGVLDRAGWERLLTALESCYHAVLVDAGSVDPDRGLPPLLPTVDQLIVCVWPRGDLLHATAALLASLERWGLTDLAAGALVVVSGVAAGRTQPTSAGRRGSATSARVDAWCEYFRDRCRDVVRLPYDRLTAASQRMLLEELGEETREASAHLAELAAGTARLARNGRS